MEKIKLIPLVGMEFSDAKIALASSQKDVKNLFGEPYSTRDHSLFYFNNELRFDFDDDGSIEFIEFLGGFDVEDLIAEAIADKKPMDEAEIEDEMKKASYWATIGIGVRDYYR